MKIYSLFILCCLASFSLQAQQNDFKKQLKTFVKAAQGLYEVRPNAPELTEAQRQPQDLLFYPIPQWNTEAESWFCFVWLSPKSKERPLEQVLVSIRPHNADTMLARFHSLPEYEADFSYEWRKAQPFAPMTADYVKTESAACEGFISLEKGGFYKMESFQPCPRDTKGSAYSAIKVDSRYYGKSYSSGVEFLDAQGRVIMQHTHEFITKRSKSSLKTY